MTGPPRDTGRRLYGQQIDLSGGLHDLAPEHERMRLFNPAPAQIAGQTHLSTDDQEVSR